MKQPKTQLKARYEDRKNYHSITMYQTPNPSNFTPEAADGAVAFTYLGLEIAYSPHLDLFYIIIIDSFWDNLRPKSLLKTISWKNQVLWVTSKTTGKSATKGSHSRASKKWSLAAVNSHGN